MSFLKRREFVLDIGARFSRATELHALLEEGVTRARELMHADRGTIFIVDRQKNQMWTEVAEGIDRIVIPLGSGLVGACYNKRKMLNVTDAKRSVTLDLQLNVLICCLSLPFVNIFFFCCCSFQILNTILPVICIIILFIAATQDS